MTNNTAQPDPNYNLPPDAPERKGFNEQQQNSNPRMLEDAQPDSGEQLADKFYLAFLANSRGSIVSNQFFKECATIANELTAAALQEQRERILSGIPPEIDIEGREHVYRSIEERKGFTESAKQYWYDKGQTDTVQAVRRIVEGGPDGDSN